MSFSEKTHLIIRWQTLEHNVLFQEVRRVLTSTKKVSQAVTKDAKISVYVAEASTKKLYSVTKDAGMPEYQSTLLWRPAKNLCSVTKDVKISVCGDDCTRRARIPIIQSSGDILGKQINFGGGQLFLIFHFDRPYILPIHFKHFNVVRPV